MSTFSVSELESAIEKWKVSTGIAPPKWKDKDGFWLGSGYPRGASTGAEVDVVREELWSDDPRNATERVVVRSGNREVVFWEPNFRKHYRVDVSVSEGDVTKAGYVSRREEAEQLLDVFFRQRCRFEELPAHIWDS